jgi:hypothetical protein
MTSHLPVMANVCALYEHDCIHHTTQGMSAEVLKSFPVWAAVTQIQKKMNKRDQNLEFSLIDLV